MTPANPPPTERGSGDTPLFPPRAKILPGDDSLLIKYQNPNFIAVFTGRPGVGSPPSPLEERLYGGAAAAPSPAAVECPPSSTPPPGVEHDTLTLTMLDTVTGRVLHSRLHKGARGPVSATMHDNWVVYSYWNSWEGRGELGVATLWERAAVNTYDLTPWAPSNPITSAYLSPAPVSSHAMATPFVKHAVFIPGDTVLSLHMLSGKGGVSPPAILLHTNRLGIQALELRWIDPRRPMWPPMVADPLTGKLTQQAVPAGSPPTPPPSPEGLAPYSPYLPNLGASFLSHGVPLHRVRTVVTGHTEWESSGLVAVLGLDTFIARVSTAKKFDQLDRDFNKGVFMVAIISGLFITWLLHYFAQRKAFAERELLKYSTPYLFYTPLPSHFPTACFFVPLSYSRNVTNNQISHTHKTAYRRVEVIFLDTDPARLTEREGRLSYPIACLSDIYGELIFFLFSLYSNRQGSQALAMARPARPGKTPPPGLACFTCIVVFPGKKRKKKTKEEEEERGVP